jgi:hypothetical protein
MAEQRDGRTDVAANVVDNGVDHEDCRVSSFGRQREGEHAVTGGSLVIIVIYEVTHPLLSVQLEHKPFAHPCMIFVEMVSTKTIHRQVLRILSKAIILWDKFSGGDDIHMLQRAIEVFDDNNIRETEKETLQM